MPSTDHPGILLFRHAWLLFVLVTCFNAAIWWYRARRRIAQDPGLEPGYRQLIRWWVICGNLPWLVMGAGILFGEVPTVFQLFFRQGAEQLVAHLGLLNLPVERPWAVKTFFLLALAGGVLGLLTMLLGDIQVPFSTPNPR
jgi:hypothetical protein